MALFNNIWSGLKIGYQKGYIKLGNEAMPFIDLRYRKAHDGTLVYKSHAAYKSVFEFLARQTALQFAERTLNGLWPKYVKSVEEAARKKVLAQQDIMREAIIKEGQAVEMDLDYLDMPDEPTKTIRAVDKYGEQVTGSLILYYVGEDSITVTRSKYNGSAIDSNAEKETFTTKTRFFIDLAPEVSVSSSKNLILTNVQGRDYSRKELVGGGDLKFSVSGNIVYDEPDVYPQNDVRKFIEIMQYGGVIHVKHLMFQQFGITSIIIQDFSLGKPDMKNMQPYSFSCVAVEPDEDVRVTDDTINIINHQIASSPLDGWYRLVLGKKSLELDGNNKYINMGANIATNAAMGAIGSLTDLVPNI